MFQYYNNARSCAIARKLNFSTRLLWINTMVQLQWLPTVLHCTLLYRVKYDPYTKHCRGWGVWAYLGRVFSIAEQLGMHTHSIGPLFGQKVHILRVLYRKHAIWGVSRSGVVSRVGGREGKRGREAGVALFWVLYRHSVSIIFLECRFTSPDHLDSPSVYILVFTSMLILGYCFLLV